MKHFISSLSVLCANTPPCEGRVSSRKFLSLLLILFLGVGNAWGVEETVVYTETFEDSAYKTSTTYNNSSEMKHGPTNTQWGVLCGTPNTGAHNGSKAFAMRYYKSVSKTPTLTQYFDINNVDAISFWSKTESTNNKLNVEYSTDGGSSWSSLASNISITTSYKEYSYNFSTQQAKVRLRFTMGTTTEKKSMLIDDIEFISTSSTGSGTEEPVISVEPNKVDFGTKNIYFESEKQGSLEIEITGQNLTGNVTAAISGTDASVFTLSKTTFTPNSGEVSETLSVSYSVSEVKNYTATLTLSSDGVDAIELPITLTTVNKKPTIYTKVTDAATLSAGDKVIFVYEAGKKAAGALSSGYLTSIDIAQAINTTANPATVSITDEAVIEYTLGGTTGAWEFISASGKLSEASANSTKSVDLAYNKGTTWTIAISSGNATIKGTTNTIQYNEANPRFKTYTSGQKTIQLYAISVPKYAVNFIQPEGGELNVKNGETAITSGNTFAEGVKLTVTATPANSYEGGTVVVKDADGNDVTATVYADGVLTMPAYAVTISATFEEKECTLLTTPVVTATPTYNSATLTWGAVTNAAKYSVKIGSTDAVETTETSYEVTGLNAETTYTYQVKAIAEAEQDMYCDSEVAEGSFTTTAAPVATLTLSDIDGTTTQTGALNGTITLPTTAAECSKTFVGWDSKSDCAVAPEYAPGAEYTLAAENQTLYAVYADGEGGGTVTIKHNVPTTGTSTNMTGQNDAETFFGLDNDEWSILSAKNGAQNHIGVNKDGTLRLYYHANGGSTLTITAPKDVASIVLNCNSSYKNAWVKVDGNLVSPIDGVYSINAKTFVIGNANTENKQVYVQSIEVTLAGVFSNYSTTCTAALEKPTFSVAEGTYTEAKSIELSATEGTIYYTLDGSTPTASSEKYTTPIVLDECGTTTIKAIAISTESQSPVASATYTINLPITNTAATAYTPTEAIAIIDGACDKSEEVYVKGVVVSTSEFNATYGNYDVIVKAVDDNSATPTTFTFYRMYKAASETKFTASDEVIGVGDIITAKGKLTKYNTTYELAEGCYMVERVAFTEPKTDISNTEATAYTVDKAFELISDIKSDLDKEVYVKGFVAVASTQLYNEKYLTYSISDNGQTTGNVLKVYDGLDIGGEAFASKDDVKAGDYVVVKGKLLNYGGTYEINKDNQLVQHVKAATITIADITMEVGETKTIAATITPDAAKTEVAYSIKAGSDDCITLSDNNITAKAEGTATIVATIATAAEYMGKTVEFKVTVTPKSTKEKVVVLAEYDGKWYAMMAKYVTGKTSHLVALPVTYFDGKLYNVNEADKALIEWERAVVDGKATFYNDGKYLTGKSGDTDLTLAATACEWTISEDSYLIGARTFLYNAENNWFRNFGTGNAGNKNYSDMPTVTAPVYATGDIVYTRTATPGSFSTICLPYAGTISGATLFDLSDRDETYVYVVEAGTTLEAGKPYVILPTANEIVVTCKNYDYVAAGNYNTLYGTYKEMNSDELDGKYVITGNKYYYVNKEQSAGSKLLAYRAYFNLYDLPTAPASAPGARRIALGTNGQNTATGMENVDASAQPVKMIINGQLYILRGEKMYDAQGKLVK